VHGTVVRDIQQTVLAVDGHSMWICERGVVALNHADRRLRALGRLVEHHDRVVMLDRQK
jgi:hypothetical protein